MRNLIVAIFCSFASSVFGQGLDCFDFPSLSATEADALNNDTLYPGGSVIMSDAGIDIIIPYNGYGMYPDTGTIIGYYVAYSLQFSNQLDLDLSGLPYDYRDLTFSLLNNGFVVDSDTIFHSAVDFPVLPVVTAAYTFDTTSAGFYRVWGYFDIIHIFGLSDVLSDLCVKEFDDLGFRHSSNLHLNISPNPSLGQFTFKSNSDTNMEIRICDGTGQRLIQVNHSNSTFVDIDLGAFGPGIYFAEVFSGDSHAVHKLVVQ